MKRLATLLPAILLLVFAAGLSGCGPSEATRYAGTWELDTAIVKAAIEAEIASIEDEEERQAMEAGMALMGSRMLEALRITLVLNEDGTAVSTTSMMGESETVNGNWSVADDVLTIEMTGNGESQTIRGRVEDDLLELLPAEDEELPFPMVLRKQPG